MRPITVYPKPAPKVIIRTQMPTRAVLPTAPLCSTEKKKYTSPASRPPTRIRLRSEPQKNSERSNPLSPITIRGMMLFRIWLRKSAWM